MTDELAIPEKIQTPDRVETRIGALEFRDGFPTDDTAQRLFDHLDFVRAVEVFLQCVPAASLEAMRSGMVDIGIDSISRQDVLVLTMEALGLNLPMVQLFGPRNIGELADLLHAKLPR